MTLEIRALNPDLDLELCREAYGWRTRRKKHIQPDRLPFEEFSKADPHQVVMGLFNGEFLAAYLINEFSPGRFDLHFTSKKGAARDHLVAGGIWVTDWLIENGATEVSAIIVHRNRPLREFLLDCGFGFTECLTFPNLPLCLKYTAIR